MNFPTNIDQHALHQAQAIYHQLPNLQGGERIDHLYMHWSVSPYDSTFSDYNVCVTGKSNSIAQITHNPRHNAVQVQSGTEYAAHTWHRNSFALGVAVCCMGADPKNNTPAATPSNFGNFPVTLSQLEVMTAVIGALGKKYNVDCSDGDRVMTHAEAAAKGDLNTGANKYFGERWDLERFTAGGDPVNEDNAYHHGGLLRARAHIYKLAIK